MSGGISFTGPGSPGVGDIGGVSGASGVPGGQPAPTSDSISSGGGSAGSGTVSASTPQLDYPAAILWMPEGGGNPILLQLYGSSDSTSIQPIDADLVRLQVENSIHETCIKMLDQWSESIKKEADAERRERNSPLHQEWEARQGNAGYSQWYNTLTPEQQIQVDGFTRLNTQQMEDKGIVTGMTDYITQIKATLDPALTNNLAFITSSTIIGNTLHFHTAAGADVVGPVVAVQIDPIQKSGETLMGILATQFTADMAAFGSMLINGAAFASIGMVIPIAGVDNAQEINYQFAQDYANRINNTVNSEAFAAIVGAMVTQSTNGAATAEEIDLAVKQSKIALLSSALSTLYYTETGGMTGKEFLDLLDGNITGASELAKGLAAQINGLIDSMPGSRDQIRTLLSDWVDQSESARSTLNIKSLYTDLGITFTPPSTGPIRID